VTINVGLVGFGLAGRLLHLPLIRAAGMRVASIVTSQREAVAASLPDASVHDCIETMLERDAIDLVVITSPNHLHKKQAEASLRAGKHVVIEKPFTLHAHEADALIALASGRSLCLSVFHNRRWDSDVMTLQDLMARGELGEIHYAQLRWDRFRPQVVPRWREMADYGGGVLYDLGSHLIDQALQLFGDPDWLQADVFAQRGEANVDDGFEILLGVGSLRVSLGANSTSAADGVRYRIYGSKGSWIKRGIDIQETQLRSGMDPLAGDFGVEASETWGVYSINDAGPAAAAPGRATPAMSGCWLQFYRDIVRSIQIGSPPPVTGPEARRVIQVIEACFQSSREGRRIAF
jgi:scyllo-inositol 2-dehydrogenase (NADP+)